MRAAEDPWSIDEGGEARVLDPPPIAVARKPPIRPIRRLNRVELLGALIGWPLALLDDALHVTV